MNTLDAISQFSNACKLLYVASDETSKESLVKALETLFDDVSTQLDAKEALAEYNNFFSQTKSFYDIVLIDIDMPKADALELLKSIKAINEKQIVLLYSQHVESEYLIEAIELGVDKFLLKSSTSLNKLLLTLEELRVK